jgi:hypothetical protein
MPSMAQSWFSRLTEQLVNRKEKNEIARIDTDVIDA